MSSPQPSDSHHENKPESENTLETTSSVQAKTPEVAPEDVEIKEKNDKKSQKPKDANKGAKESPKPKESHKRTPSALYSDTSSVRSDKRSLPVNFSSENLASIGHFDRRSSHGYASSIGSKRRTSVRQTIVREKKDLHDINQVRDFFTKPVDRVAHDLGVNAQTGLTDEDLVLRKKVFGPNQLKKEKGVSFIRLFLHHLFGVLNFILLAASIASVVVAIVEESFDWIEGVLIFFIIVANTLIGFIQEYRSAKTMQSLMKMFAPEADVIRKGERQTVPASALVPGDIVLLEDGDFVPADMRLIEAVNLSIDEAFLTGESDPVAKVTMPLKPEEAKALGDRTNMGFMSSIVTGGRGKGIVVRTGEDTELGEIAKKLRSGNSKKKTELQKSMTTLGLGLFLAAIGFSFLVLAIQVLAVGTGAFSERGTWLYIVALCVAMIPEGLPAVLALTLAMGMRSMAKKNAIVRKLGVLESLNWITDICSDKTGTLTEGKMVANLIWCEEQFFKVSGVGIIPEGNIQEMNGNVVSNASLNPDRQLTKFLHACSLCNMATLTKVDDEWQATSSPTEIALQCLAYKAELPKPMLLESHQFMGEHPFDSNWKRMSVIYKKSNIPIDPELEPIESIDAFDTVLYMKGSVESVLGCCKYQIMDEDLMELDEETRQDIIHQAEEMASQGLRVLACAMKENFKFSTEDNRQKTDQGSTFLGLAGIMDPPRSQSKPAVEKAHKAGITVYMLTGDHKKTAANIAKQVGIIQNDLYDRVTVGSQFESEKVIGNNFPKAIARCNPETKIKMIEELHVRDRFVCMTGDGVNDAPAIKKSDVGVAMGINGSEVTKDSADIILLDDNFGTIIVAIEEGRRIFENIYKIILFLMTNNVGEIMILIIGLCFSFFNDGQVLYPLTPMQILWLNVITDTPVCMALGAEPVQADAMNRPPKSRTDGGLFNMEMNIDIMFYGFIVGALSLANFAITYFTDDNRQNIVTRWGKSFQEQLYVARAVCFFTITFCMLFHGLNALHKRNSILLHRFEKKWILITIAASAVSMLITVYVPWVNVHIFKQYNLGYIEWIQIVVAIAIFAICSEIYKIMKKCIIQSYHSGAHVLNIAENIGQSISNIDVKLKSEEG